MTPYKTMRGDKTLDKFLDIALLDEKDQQIMKTLYNRLMHNTSDKNIITYISTFVAKACLLYDKKSFELIINILEERKEKSNSEDARMVLDEIIKLLRKYKVNDYIVSKYLIL